jgi:hypothetical protein
MVGRIEARRLEEVLPAAANGLAYQNIGTDQQIR